MMNFYQQRFPPAVYLNLLGHLYFLIGLRYYQEYRFDYPLLRRFLSLCSDELKEKI